MMELGEWCNYQVSVITMPAFCTSGLRSPALLTGCDPIMRCGVNRQLPVGHAVYHGDMHAVYLRQYHQQQQQQVRGETKRQEAPTDAVKKENENDKERNLATAMLCAGPISNGKTPKYDFLSALFSIS